MQGIFKMIYLLIGILSTVFITVKFLFKLCLSNESGEDCGLKEEWYGKGEPSELNKEDSSFHSFEITIPDEVLEDLKHRLNRTRLEEPLKESKFHNGFNPDYLKEIVEYWKTQYNWREEEKNLNKYPHFKTRIEGINVHFMHIKPFLTEDSKLKVVPLIMIHGWPGSFAEFLKVIPLLTNPQPGRSFVFEVICPSIPGFGFSDSPHRKGFNARAAARVFTTLMERIGHQRFYVQGGDWGSYIASLMARYYPQQVIGLHVNSYFFQPHKWEKIKFILVMLFPFLVSKIEYKTIFPLKKKLSFMYQEMGYFHMHTTKPDTLGCSMSDSPVGLAAYLLEKFSVGTNRDFLKMSDGGLTQKFSLNELLTNVMIYWLNNNFTSGARFYKENLKDLFATKHEKFPVTVPSGIAFFINEPLMFPRMLLTGQMENLVSYNILEKGGHFAAMEEPQLFADDVWNFVHIVENR